MRRATSRVHNPKDRRLSEVVGFTGNETREFHDLRARDSKVADRTGSQSSRTSARMAKGIKLRLVDAAVRAGLD